MSYASKALVDAQESKIEKLEAKNAKLLADLKDMTEILVEFARGHDEVRDMLNVDGRVMPDVIAYLLELGIEISVSDLDGEISVNVLDGVN